MKTSRLSFRSLCLRNYTLDLQFASSSWQVTSGCATFPLVAKRFDQYCPIAHALSLVGERWALLIVRELLRGEKRYTDLAAGLPGIGTNILADRLRELEQAGVVRRRKLPPPAASTVYELTEYGAGLEETIHALARWGARTLGPPGPDDELDSDWGVNAFQALFNPEAARGLSETYVVRAGGAAFTARVEDGCLHVETGAAEGADLDVAMDMDTFFAVASGDVDPRDAATDGSLAVTGDPDALARCFTVFSFAPRTTPRLADGPHASGHHGPERFARPAATG
jgi:DNA-binding HxlR family transcriptional regulator